MEALRAVGNFLASDTAPWWAVLGAPLLTFWLGQRTSAQATREQREADADQRQADREAEAQRAREAREAEDAANAAEARGSAFVAALDAIASLRAELAKSSIEVWGDPDDHGTRLGRFIPENAVSPDVLRQFAASMNRLRIYTDSAVLDRAEVLVQGVTEYMATYADNHPGGEYRPLMADLADLSEIIGHVFNDERPPARAIRRPDSGSGCERPPRDAEQGSPHGWLRRTGEA